MRVMAKFQVDQEVIYTNEAWSRFGLATSVKARITHIYDHTEKPLYVIKWPPSGCATVWESELTAVAADAAAREGAGE